MPRRLTCLVILLVGTVVPATAPAEPGPVLTAEDRGLVGSLAELATFTTTLRNTGAATDTFTVTVTRDLPAAWTVSLCEGTVCYPPFVATIEVVLSPGADTIIEVDVVPLDQPAVGTVTLAAVSGSDPGSRAELDLTLATSGLDVLIVAGDGGGGAAVYLAAVAATGHRTGVWPRGEAGVLDAADLAGFPAVVWFTGADGTGLAATDLGPLAYYVQHGGGLLLSGQDVVRAGCDPASATYSPATAAWFGAVLGLAWTADDSGEADLVGVPGDPVGGGFAATLGAASTSPDVLAAAGGQTCLTYGTGTAAAVRHLYGAGHAVGCGFGIEDLSEPSARRDLIGRTLGWFFGPAAVDPVAVPLTVRIGPNPANPALQITWQRPTAGPLRIAIHDLAGRRVALLHEGAAAATGRSVWRGRTADGRPAPSGVYLCRIESPGATLTRKLTLVR